MIMNLKKMKELTDLYGYIIKPEKSSNKIILHKIFYDNYVQISLCAFVWDIKSYKRYERYKAQINIEIREFMFLNNNKINFN